MNPLSELQVRAAQLQSELTDRVSTDYFARTGIAMVTSLTLAGASSKLFWDGSYYFALPTAAVSMAGWIYALVQYLRGKRYLHTELEKFASLKILRKELHLDDPAALLPQ